MGVEYGTSAEAEAAFKKLLKKVGVQADWTWEQAIRASIQDLSFRAIKGPTQRKEAFERYQDELQIMEREREKERIVKLRTDFRTMLGRHPEIKHYTRWKTALPIIKGESVFRSTDNEDEKKKLFREYIGELRHQHEEKRHEDHEAAMRDLSTLMRDINVTPETRWEDARAKLKEHPTFAGDEKYQTLADFELLDQFQAQVKRLWEDVNTIKQREKQLKHRRERKARDGFVDLLRELQEQDKIGPDTEWKAIYPLVENEPRYQALLENVETGDERRDGSTPLDLFFDALEDLDREQGDVKLTADSALREARFKFTTKTTLEEFMDVVQEDKRLAYTKKSVLEAAYKKLQHKANSNEEDLVRDEKRHQRRAIDALRSRIKRLEPPVELEDTWEDIRPRLEKYDEYAALSEDDRRAAYEKHMTRLNEDADLDRERRRHRPTDRRRSRSHGRRPRSRTPLRESDAYEADRRRAVEQRERQFRRPSPGGLSPPPRDRERRRDFDERRARDDRYERERRERDVQREHAYIVRADPYAKATDLDYGDSSDAVSARAESRNGNANGNGNGNGNGAVAKRAGSEGRDGRVRKRARTEGRLADEKVDADGDKEMAVQSGSEEGEIEEV